MLYGYVMAVLAGFLFTAVRNWTGRPTPTGATLAGFAALWVAGRVLVMTPYELAAAWVNAAFPVAVSITGLLTACAKRGSAFANTVMPFPSTPMLGPCGNRRFAECAPPRTLRPEVAGEAHTLFTEREPQQAGPW